MKIRGRHAGFANLLAIVPVSMEITSHHVGATSICSQFNTDSNPSPFRGEALKYVNPFRDLSPHVILSRIHDSGIGS